MQAHEKPRWKLLTPLLSNEEWVKANLYVTSIANHYAETHNKRVSHTGAMNLNALNFGWDRAQLDSEYGRYPLNMVMQKENLKSELTRLEVSLNKYFVRISDYIMHIWKT